LIYRQVITLTLEGLSYREIAQVLGIGESNVGVRLNRARQLLRTTLEDER
jgi:RNA polymerase sigma-70 factor (ECF subfamily)